MSFFKDLWDGFKSDVYWSVTGKERYTYEWRDTRRGKEVNPIRVIDAFNKKDK